ncbi:MULTISPECIES: hypothetical protein [Burkholderia]|uniref:hypothetical protein n=1 Tax=Burkholderia TaxID=32008 RepID=UPI001583F328|nr:MULTISPECIES: hypothetical protein [Burkholderia]
MTRWTGLQALAGIAVFAFATACSSSTADAAQPVATSTSLASVQEKPFLAQVVGLEWLNPGIYQKLPVIERLGKFLILNEISPSTKRLFKSGGLIGKTFHRETSFAMRRSGVRSSSAPPTGFEGLDRKVEPFLFLAHRKPRIYLEIQTYTFAYERTML